MTELLFTTEAFQPQGLPMPNVPMLLDAEMRLIESACAWLLHVALARGRTRSKETWRTYGEALYDWWQTLETNGWAWDKVGSMNSPPIAIACLKARAITRVAPIHGRRSTSASGCWLYSIVGARHPG